MNTVQYKWHSAAYSQIQIIEDEVNKSNFCSYINIYAYVNIINKISLGEFYRYLRVNKSNKFVIILHINIFIFFFKYF